MKYNIQPFWGLTDKEKLKIIMSEHITYCMSECNDMKCFRNKKHIKLQIPHCFEFLEGTQYCHKIQKGEKRK